MCAIDGGERPDVYSGTYIKAARKPHKCEECSRTIDVGEPYHRAFMVYDRIVSTFLTCQHCCVGHGWLLDNCGGFMHAGLIEEMSEHIEEYPDISFGLYRIKAGMLRRWKRFDGAGLMPVQPMPASIESKYMRQQS